jgi:hypothetical protein
MTPQQLLVPLIQQLELLAQVINESPYISREGRLELAKEITALKHQLKEGEIEFPSGEQSVSKLNKKAAADEISTLSSKIRHLNPSSPRLENLRSLGTELQQDEISPEQARRRLQELMHA